MSESKLDRLVAEARGARDAREAGYRERALKMYPWICGRCEREFTRANLHELTVHHRDHDHDNNPPDGSNWELLCVYCHDNEHQRQLEAAAGHPDAGETRTQKATHSPFAGLRDLLGTTRTAESSLASRASGPGAGRERVGGMPLDERRDGRPRDDAPLLARVLGQEAE